MKDRILVWLLGFQYSGAKEWMTYVPGNIIGTIPTPSAHKVELSATFTEVILTNKT